MPLNRVAADFYSNGPSRLQAFLPFRLAAWIDRFLAAGIAIGSAALTLFRILPAMISLPFRRRIKQSFSDLQALERSAAAGTDHVTLLEQLNNIDRATADIKAPLRSLESQWMELRQYLHDMRDRLNGS